MKEAIAEAKKSQAEDAGPHPKVGAILVDPAGTIIARSHRGEVMRESDGKKDAAHAEETILTEKIANGKLSDATLFVTLEPCFHRGSQTSCTKHIIDRGVQQVYIGSLDPNPGICGKGEEYLRAHGITVERFPDRLIREIESLHREWVQAHRDKLLPPTSLYVTMQIADIIWEQLLRKGLDIPELPADWDVTIEDVIPFCAHAKVSREGKTVSLRDEIMAARRFAFDKKYKDYTYDIDTRGLDDHWKQEIQGILRDRGHPNYANDRIINVGIGNGLEGVGLFDSVSQFIGVDLAESSLEAAKRHLPRALFLRLDAENLDKIESGSQDIYVSFRTYQSTYFDITSAQREACRVVRQGGVVLISIANGFLGPDRTVIPGLVIPRTRVVDPNRPFELAERIRRRLAAWRFEDVGIKTGRDEIYIWGRRAR